MDAYASYNIAAGIDRSSYVIAGAIKESTREAALVWRKTILWATGAFIASGALLFIMIYLYLKGVI